jgi:cell division protease FtsH
MKNLLLGAVLGFFLAVVLLIALTSAPTPTSPRPRPLTDYSRFIADVDEGKIEEVTFRASWISGRFKDGRVFESFGPHAQVIPALTDRLLAKGIRVAARPPPEDDPPVPSLVNVLINWAPFFVVYTLFFVGLWFIITRPVLALIRQLETYIKPTQQRSSGPPPSPP